MAIYHFTAKKGQQGKHSAKAKSDYILREGKYQRDALELIAVGSGNMPEWTQGHVREYWKAADAYERVNGRLFRQYEFSLPRELTAEQQKQLANSFCREMATGKEGNLPYSYAIHRGKDENPHCHLMISERINDGYTRTPETWFKRANKSEPEKGGAIKAESLEHKDWLIETRKKWADRANLVLEQAGVTVKIDHRTLEQQGIDRLAMPHIGPHVLQMEEKGLATRKGQEAIEVAIKNERRRTIERSTELTGVSRTDRTVGTEHGGFGGRLKNPDREEQGRIHTSDFRSTESFSGTCNDFPNSQGENRKFRQGSENSSRSSDGGQHITTSLDTSILVSDNDNSFDGSIDRILFLGGFLQRKSKISERSSAEKRMGGQTIQSNGRRNTENIQQYSVIRDNSNGFEKASARTKNEDRTIEAVKNQIRAMGCKTFELGIRDQKNGKMIHREVSVAQIVAAVPWLKRMNAQGNDIYIRPNRDEQRALILLDDIDGVTVDMMKDRGCSPACVVQTSHKNLQAWVSVGSSPMPEFQRKELAGLLAREFEGDKASAAAHHFGRLAGFTNRKPDYLQRGGFPYVLCKESTGKEAEKSLQMRGWAEEREQAQKRAEIVIEREKAIKIQRYTYRDENDTYRAYMREWLEKQDGTPDWSKGDYATTCRMLKEGFETESIAKAMLENSPNLVERKQNHVEDYITRTIQSAARNPETVKELEEKARERRGSRLSL